MRYKFLLFVALSSILALVECRAASRDCHDTFHNCETWRRSGFCGANSHAFYLRNGCAKTCGFCKSSSPVNNNIHSVQDVHRTAHKIGQKANLASDTVSHKQNKAASVGALHHQKLHAPPQVTQHHKTSDESGEEKPDCRDTYRESPYCDEWKSRGFCETYKEQLDTYCPKTCGFCINAKYEENSTPSQNATAQPTPAQTTTVQLTPSPNSTAQPTPSPNSTAQTTPSQNFTAKPPSPEQNETSSDAPANSLKHLIRSRPIAFAETGNTNTKRGFPEGDSPLWSVNADTRLTLPRPQQYDDMGGAVRRPLEDGTYFTPAKTNEKFEYYTEHYSPDPYVAAAQREEWMSSNAGNGLSPNPSLSRKSKNPEVKEEKETVKVLKKSNVRHAKHVNKNKQ